MIGELVTILVDYPCGVDEEQYYVKNETGLVVKFDEETEMWEVKTGNSMTSGWWFSKDEIRPATTEECMKKLKLLLWF